MFNIAIIQNKVNRHTKKSLNFQLADIFRVEIMKTLKIHLQYWMPSKQMIYMTPVRGEAQSIVYRLCWFLKHSLIKTSCNDTPPPKKG